MKDYNYKIYIPSGNPTALVIGIIKDLNKRKEINNELMSKYDFVEQVGFINPDINNPELVMAGGEFCGNATRSAIKYYLRDQEGLLKIKVSGVKKKLDAGIDKNGNVWVDMPIIKGDYKNSVTQINGNSAIIRMYGITHLVIESDDINKKYSKEKLKEYAYEILEEYNLLQEDAAGVMFIEKRDNNIELTPIVFVREINTLFYETACGSGTTAVAIYESFKTNKNVSINVLQPSGKVINVETKTENNSILNVRISGKVEEYETKNDFVKYQDLLRVNKINKKTMKEEFVSLPIESNKVIGRYVTNLNELEYSNIIRVRKEVFNKLTLADTLLKKINKDYQIMVVYGYRSMEKQVKYFNEEIKKYEKDFDNQLDLYEFVHEKIAVPKVSGHPTGGAVDVVIFDMKKGEIIDFGTKVHDFDDSKSYITYMNISDKAYSNRIMLRNIMMQVGFAPYDGEWWHFSYGDSEWAYYYQEKEYLYSQVSKDEVYKEEL